MYHRFVADRGAIWRRRTLRPIIAAALIAGLSFAALLAPLAHAATITVNTTTDEVNADGDCSLREALIAANTDAAVDACPAGSGADIIDLPAGTYSLTIAGSGTTAGDLDITSAVTLLGAGPNTTIIDGNGIDRVLAIYAGSSANISRVTISGGSSGVAAGSGIWLRDSTLTMTNVRVRDNTPNHSIYLLGTSSLNLVGSRVEQNTGGIYMQSTTTATILNSTISGNTGASDGGGILNSGTLTVVNSTISGNSAPSHGGGILSSGTASLYNVTISNNTADSDASGAGDGGGVYINPLGTGTFTARNSVIGGNSDASPSGTPRPDCYGTLTGQGYNLIENTSGCTIAGDTTGNLTGSSPNLGPLQNNGGSTFTHALLAGSPAINAGNPAGCVDQNSAPLTTDQRVYVRNSTCDMGAYEYNSPGAATPTSTLTPTRTPTRTPTATRISTSTPTATRTFTPGPSPTHTPTNAPTATPSQAHTATPGPSPTFGPSPTPPQSPDGPTPAPTATVISEFPIRHWLYLPAIQN